MGFADLAWYTITMLIGAGFLAGLVDAIVGGGGLIQLPALFVGLPSQTPFSMISGTNKISSVAGTSMAAATYIRKIKIDPGVALILIIGAVLGAGLGAAIAGLLPKKVFPPIIFVAMVGIGIYTWKRPALGMSEHPKLSTPAARVAAGLIGLGIGLWDGLVGPGTGTFFILLFVTIIGSGFLQASAYAKLGNLTTNVAAIIVFGWHGNILWWLGLPMAAANLIGGLIGAKLALRHGNGFIRIVFLLVVAVLAVKLGWDCVVIFSQCCRQG